MALLTLDGVTKRFGGLLANNSVSFEVAEGEILALQGGRCLDVLGRESSDYASRRSRTEGTPCGEVRPSVTVR